MPVPSERVAGEVAKIKKVLTAVNDFVSILQEEGLIRHDATGKIVLMYHCGQIRDVNDIEVQERMTIRMKF